MRDRRRNTVYDALGRIHYRTWNTAVSYSTVFSYAGGANGSSTGQVSAIKNGTDPALRYYYNANGNITGIMEGDTNTVNNVTGYQYDIFNRLTRVNDPKLNKTIVYAYDAGGNITEKKIYAMTTGSVSGTPLEMHTFTYDSAWKDQLKSIRMEKNDGTVAVRNITYDAIGNPLTYGAWHMAWTQGRRLESMYAGTSKHLKFKYNESGMRVEKEDVINHKRYSYHVAGSVILGEKCINTTDGSTIYTNRYEYDSSGELIAVIYNGTEYYYIRNGQNDIIGLVDGSGNVVVRYSYDSWGKPITTTGNLATTLGVRNPFRYRGYYYDAETSLYYVKSRYYEPEIGRWISADSAIGQIGNNQSYNMYTYCFGNPVVRDDSSGCWPKLSTIFTVAAVAAIAVAAVAITVATCGATAPVLAVSGAMAVAQGAVLAAGVSSVAAVTATAVESITSKYTARDNFVYVLKDEKKSVQYVGRTKNVVQRANAHNQNPYRRGLEMVVIQDSLTLPEARALEQSAMLYHHTINTANRMNNQINGVAPKHWGIYKEIARGTLEYEWNMMTNEILYWIEE